MSPVVHPDLIFLKSLSWTIGENSKMIKTSLLAKPSSLVLTEESTSKIPKGYLQRGFNSIWQKNAQAFSPE